MLTQIVANGVVAGSLYALVALGFGMIYSGTRILHIAHGAIFTAASYIYLMWVTLIGGMLDQVAPLLVGSAILLTLASSIVLVFLLEFLLYKPLQDRHSPPLVTFLASLGAYLTIVNLVALLNGDETKILPVPVMAGAERMGSILLTTSQIIQVGVAVAVLTFCIVLARQTTFDRNRRALADDPILMEVLGHRKSWTRLQLLACGSVLATIAALLRSLDVGFNPHVGLSVVLSAAVAVIVGSAESPIGTIYGAFLLGILQNVVVFVFSAQWAETATFITLILALTFRRRGLLASAARLEET